MRKLVAVRTPAETCSGRCSGPLLKPRAVAIALVLDDRCQIQVGVLVGGPARNSLRRARRSPTARAPEAERPRARLPLEGDPSSRSSRSASVIPVLLPSGITRVSTATRSIAAACASICSRVSSRTPCGALAPVARRAALLDDRRHFGERHDRPVCRPVSVRRSDPDGDRGERGRGADRYPPRYALRVGG